MKVIKIKQMEELIPYLEDTLSYREIREMLILFNREKLIDLIISLLLKKMEADINLQILKSQMKQKKKQEEIEIL